jgi:hypothetical protein
MAGAVRKLDAVFGDVLPGSVITSGLLEAVRP